MQRLEVSCAVRHIYMSLVGFNKLYVSQLSVHVPFLFSWIIESKLHSKSEEVLEFAVQDTVGEEGSFNPSYTREFTLFEFAQHEFL
jgi:hypothetical protein